MTILKADEVYRDYNIYFDPPPIPNRNHDWQFVHKDWDLEDHRHGSAPSLEEAKKMIDEMEDSE